MEEIISLKKKKLSKVYNAFMKNIEQCLEIANEVKESIFDAAKDDDNAILYEQNCNIVIKNIDILSELFQKFDQEIYKSYSVLDLAGKCYHINHFTYPKSDVTEYKVNDVGECVITNIDSVAQHHCHIFNVEKPPLNYLKDYQGRRFTTLPPASGEVFAIELGLDGLCRAVRNDFMNEGSKSMLIQLIDTGEKRCVRKDYENMYELPKVVQDVKSRAILCKVLKIVNENGISLNMDDGLKKILGKQVFYKIVKVKNSILFIKITSNSSNVIKEESHDEFESDLVDLLSDEGIASNIPEINLTESIERSSLDKLTAVAESLDSCVALQEIADDNGLPESVITGEYVENGIIQKKIFTEPLASACTRHKNLRMTLRTPRQHGIASTFSEDICTSPNKQTLEMNRSVLKIRKRTKVNSARARKTGRNKLEANANEPTTSKRSNHTKEYKSAMETCLEKNSKAFTSVETTSKRQFKSKTETGQYHCKECEKLFNHKSTFNRHILSHTGEKPFVCRVCSKAFSLLANLKKHLRIHTKL